MSERELVTVAFGNYSTLVAAQWANGTSTYDQHHRTLFSEKAVSRVQGGSVGTSGVARVPRLVLFDAPHTSNFEDVYEVEAHLAHQKDHNEEEGNGNGEAEGMSMLWRSSGPALTSEEQQLQSLARQLEHQWWDRGDVPLDSSDDDDEKDPDARQHSEDGDDEASYEEDGYQYSRLITAEGEGAGGEQRRSHGYTAQHEDGAENEDVDHHANAEPANEDSKPLTKHQIRQLKRRLFRIRDRTVPWWRYITTGLDRESILALRPLHNVDGAGDIPLLHSLGFGLRNLTPSASEEVSQLCDALRRQMEDADHVQGLQTFIDGDSLFAGVAHNVLESFWEDEGAKVPVTLFTSFTALPPALTDREMSMHVAFAERRQEEVWLNRLLATSCLSASQSALYVPIEMGNWGSFFASSGQAQSEVAVAEWLDDDTATAQFLATITDTALYGVRDGREVAPTTAQQGTEDGDDARTETQAAAGGRQRRGAPPPLPPAVRASNGPAYDLAEWQRTVRPTPSMRVAALMGALPIRLAGNQSRDLWDCLQGMPLLGAASGSAGFETETWGRGFVPLTHAMPKPPTSEAGRVVGHAVTLRGPGQLPSQTYPTREALLRYALPLRTSTYLPLLTRTNYPLSASFPMHLLFGKQDLARLEGQLPAGKSLRDAVVGVDAGAHTLTTFNSAPMLKDTVTHCEKILRYKAHHFTSSYGMEKDDWSERLEDVKEMHDDYRHEDYLVEDDENEGNQDW